MPIRRVVHSGLELFAMGLGFATILNAQCAPITANDRNRLAAYVQRKYLVSQRVDLEMADISTVNSNCYRMVRFKTNDRRVAVNLELFLSPDLKFLSKDLMDTNIDPIEEERVNAESLAASLVGPKFPSRGQSSAPVTIAVFSDFQCPYCARFASIIADLGEASAVKIVFHNLPLPMHSWARPAAEAAACAQEQGDSFFWAVHDFLFQNQREITLESLQPQLAAFAKQMRAFDPSRFANCILERRTARQIDDSLALAQKLRVQGTPTVFVNGRQIQVVDLTQLRTIVRAATRDSAIK